MLNLDPRKNVAQLLSAALVLGVLVGGYFLFRRTVKAVTPPIAIHETIRVAAGQELHYQLRFDSAPGRLHGQWRSSREDYVMKDVAGNEISKTKSGLTDSLVGFRILGPDGRVLHQQQESTSLGYFDIKVTRTGLHTVVLNNAGAFRSTPRSVEISAIYDLD